MIPGGRPSPVLAWPDTGLGVPVALTTRWLARWPAIQDGCDMGVATGGAEAEAARVALAARLGLAELRWLQQVHGVRCLNDADWRRGSPGPADAQISQATGVGLAVQVADCVPVVLARADRSAVAVAHAGWRGLADGVLSAAVAALGKPDEICAWVGPAVCLLHYEVGPEVVAALAAVTVAERPDVLEAGRPGHWQLDMGQAALQVLSSLGLRQVRGSGLCNRCRSDLFWSHRGRAETGIGRFAAVVWRPAS